MQKGNIVDRSLISPIISQYLEEKAEYYKKFSELAVHEKRVALRNMFTNTPEECQHHTIRDHKISDGHHEVSVRWYRPKSEAILPVIVYFHGGGWVLGDLDAQDPLCRKMSNAINCHILNVEYRLAPEHKFPAAIEDGKIVLNWIVNNSEQNGFNLDRVILAGDSAGGNISAVLSVDFNKSHETKIFHQILIYPVVDLTRFDRPSYMKYATGFGLTQNGMKWYVKQYLSDPSLASDPKVSPLFETQFSHISPTTIIAAKHDVLQSEGEEYANYLQGNGVEVKYVLFEDMIHSFLRMAELDPKADERIKQTIQIFKDLI